MKPNLLFEWLIHKNAFHLSVVNQISYQPIRGKENTLRANENSKYKQPNWLLRGKTRATKSWLVLVLHLIGSERGASFFLTNHRENKKSIPMQYLIIFDTKFKILRRTWRLPLLNSLRQWLGDKKKFGNVWFYVNLKVKTVRPLLMLLFTRTPRQFLTTTTKKSFLTTIF